jgi:hypothetical protein
MEELDVTCHTEVLSTSRSLVYAADKCLLMPSISKNSMEMPSLGQAYQRMLDAGSHKNTMLIKYQGGTGGKWQTPHQKTKDASYRGSGKIEAGDVGIWATCVKNKEGKATEELKALFEQVCSEAPFPKIEDKYFVISKRLG